MSPYSVVVALVHLPRYLGTGPSEVFKVKRLWPDNMPCSEAGLPPPSVTANMQQLDCIQRTCPRELSACTLNPACSAGWNALLDTGMLLPEQWYGVL